MASLARTILDRRLNPFQQSDFLEAEWNRADGKWKAFLGYRNINALESAVDTEYRRLLHFQPPPRGRHFAAGRIRLAL